MTEPVPTWQMIARRLGERMAHHARCEAHPHAEAVPDDCPFCCDRAAYEAYTRKVERGQVPKLSWRIMTAEEVADEQANRCTERRSPRSTVQCEQDGRKHAEFHAGRGERGQWFTWATGKEVQ